MTAEPILIPVRPCVKCGATKKAPDGRCAPCSCGNSVAYRAANREKIKIANAAYNAANREALNAKARAKPPRVRANPDTKKLREQEWRSRNKSAMRAYGQNRRALKKKAGGNISRDLSARLLVLQKGKCACCGNNLGTDFHLDHIMPLALGGSNTDGNIQLLRAICNLQKNAKHPVDFMQSRGYLL